MSVTPSVSLFSERPPNSPTVCRVSELVRWYCAFLQKGGSVHPSHPVYPLALSLLIKPLHNNLWAFLQSRGARSAAPRGRGPGAGLPPACPLGGWITFPFSTTSTVQTGQLLRLVPDGPGFERKFRPEKNKGEHLTENETKANFGFFR